MKDWIMELCPEIAEWQAELIEEQARQGMLAEREACAEVCRQMARRTQDIRSAALQEAADNILARGET